MRLTVLGCSGSLPGPDSPASGYLLEADGTRLVLDMGNGVLGPLQRLVGTDGLADIDGVVLSHLHADHCMDLCGLYVALYYGLAAQRRIPVYGPDGVDRRMAKAYGREPDPGLSGVFDFRGYTDAVFHVGAFAVRAVPVAHPVPAYAIRIEHAGRSLVYSGDTGPSPALVELAHGADLMLGEAAFPDDGHDHPPGIHLTGAQAAKHAAEADVGRLVLTHVPPWGDPRRAVGAASAGFDGPVELAKPGAVWEI